MAKYNGFGATALAVMAIAGIGAMTAGPAAGSTPAQVPGVRADVVPAAPAPAAPVEVKVQAWNMYQLPNILNLVTGTQADSDARVRASVEQLAASGADVLLLSEVNGTAGRAILDGLKEQGYTYQTPRLGESCSGVFGACSDALWSVNGGVAVVSKFPIAQSEQYVYTNYAPLAPDMFANKGAVMARIEKDGQQFWVVAMHTQADDTINDRASRTHEIRMLQAAELRRFVDTFAADGAPVIYGGDFNTEYFAGQGRRDAQGLTEFQQLVARSGINLFDPGALPYTYDAVTNKLVANQGYAGYRDTLDYVGTTGGATVRWVQIPVAGAEPVSDHEPVTGYFEITRADGSVVRTGVDPRALNPGPIERAVYFVRSSLETATRIVLLAVEDAVTAVQEFVADIIRPGVATVTAPVVAAGPDPAGRDADEGATKAGDGTDADGATAGEAGATASSTSTRESTSPSATVPTAVVSASPTANSSTANSSTAAEGSTSAAPTATETTTRTSAETTPATEPETVPPATAEASVDESASPEPATPPTEVQEAPSPQESGADTGTNETVEAAPAR
ncbi:hypothetical protein AXK57_12575 [Tsukamurella pulmonis]|uniref:sphingomyelin phosphodiesterase n=1 Tax=Tsukamurella pulmonis TaxID=47312 RepID=UPI000797D1C1|nr:sphingomyelin phosphodiesterase [Tsukamurella pulmonis]KXP09683.1 hypothetical protein AXK57_12575 [Tsukamurella pulmonis]RDH09376.1 hypothetical protein DVB88_22860 [Tsukamurella pulmonis]